MINRTKTNRNFSVVVLSSSGGSNFQALANRQEQNGFVINLLICDRDCDALSKADRLRIPKLLIEKKRYPKTLFRLIDQSIPEDTDLIVLAGFLSIIDREFCRKWQNKIINIHPSLLPKYGGKGMMGVKVQEAVMRAEETEAGCTVHYVNEIIDGGDIIAQKVIAVDYNESPWELGGRVHKEENELLPKVVGMLAKQRKSR